MKLVSCVSTSHGSLFQNTREYLEQIDLRESLFSTKELLNRKAFIMAMYNLHCKLLDQFQEKAKKFFDRYKIAFRLKEEIIPMLLEMDSESEVLRKIKGVLGKDFSVEAVEKKFQGWVEIGGGLKLSKEDRIVGIVGAINSFLGDQRQDFTMLSVKVADSTYTLGIAKAVDYHRWEYSKETSLFLYQVEILCPLIIPQENMGLNDKYLGFCWVDVFACSLFAQETWLCKDWCDKVPDLHYLYPLSVDCYKNQESLMLALQKCAACEEIQHSLDDQKFLFKNGESQQHTDVFLERIKNPVLLHLWSQCTDKKEMSGFALSVEEVNAKLTSIAFGPDPKLDVALIINSGNKAKRARPRISKLPNEWQMLVSILAEGLPVDDSAFRIDHLLKLEAKALRLIAHKALREIFLEDFKNIPFCSLTDKGELLRTKKAHAFFASWAEQDERSWWQRTKSFILEG